MYREATPFLGVRITNAARSGRRRRCDRGKLQATLAIASAIHWQLVNRNASTFSRFNRKEVVHQFESKASNELPVL
jgi:hypothetical protein